MSSSSDSSGFFETTYSQDIRIENEIKLKRNQEKTEKDEYEQNRKHDFEKLFSRKSHSIFSLPGLHFLKFTHTKIKFNIIPSEIRKFVSTKLKFYCSLQYLAKEEYWKVRRETFPANYKYLLRTMFIKRDVNDESILVAIMGIYRFFKQWTKEDEKRNYERKLKYENGEISDTELTLEDEELFLNDEEKENLFQKRQAILKRMIPPSKRTEITESSKKTTRRNKKASKKTNVSSDTSDSYTNMTNT